MKQLTALGQGAVLPKIVEFGSGVNHPHQESDSMIENKALLHFIVYESPQSSMTV